MKMADALNSFKSFNQAIIYLKQATRLCSLMRDDDDSAHQTQEYLNQIHELHEEIEVERCRDSQTKPQLPRREDSADLSSKFRVKKPRERTKLKEEFDPYTNIDAIASSAIIPAIYDSDNEEEAAVTSPPRFRKSIMMSPKLNNSRLTRNGTRIEHVQVHVDASKKSVKFEQPMISPKTPQMPIRAVNFFDDSDYSDSPKMTRHRNGIRLISESEDDVETSF